jgi:hypothetical protein
MTTHPVPDEHLAELAGALPGGAADALRAKMEEEEKDRAGADARAEHFRKCAEASQAAAEAALSEAERLRNHCGAYRNLAVDHGARVHQHHSRRGEYPGHSWRDCPHELCAAFRATINQIELPGIRPADGSAPSLCVGGADPSGSGGALATEDDSALPGPLPDDEPINRR